MRTIRTMLLAAALLPGAASAATVEMVQPPAWVIRGDYQTPITRDTRVESGDVIRTGPRARVRVALAEGSDVRVGPLARVELPRLEPPETDSGIFEGLVNVVKGAFRYTTGKAGASRERDITVRIGAVTAGIRGTDIWGKTTPERDFVVLLEGVIEAGSGDRTTRLDEAGTAYIQPRDGVAQAAVRIPTDTITRYARETARVDGRGAITPDGRWQTLLDSLRNRERAVAARQSYREAGFPVEIEQVRIDGQRWHRLLINGNATRSDARALGDAFERNFNVQGAWVRRSD